ncbi:hypothetical protein EMIHUDRAFT_214682, partial [Emiliania huxleyi CCMP1516]|uniref:MAM domain-containing protein n=2 Tax=Emiliania huxleyi TaxID=2903 RepID=A0A0D3IJB5_EMIH1
MSENDQTAESAARGRGTLFVNGMVPESWHADAAGHAQKTLLIVTGIAGAGASVMLNGLTSLKPATALIRVTTAALLLSSAAASPLACDFEVDTCAWVDSAPDGYPWTRTSGGTPLSGGGPSGDHTTGSGSYIYTEASGRPNELHRLESPRFSLQQDATLSFFYHMRGSDMGTLSFEAYDSETGWSTLWSRTGNQGNSWLDAAVVLPDSTTQVRFNGKTGSYVIALDDVSFSHSFAQRAFTIRPLAAPTIGAALAVVQASPLTCDFEVDACAWTDTAPDGYPWTRTSGSPPSSPDTGPSGDHTTGSGYYLFTEASSPRFSKLHRLESPLFSLERDATLSFFYHMLGSQMGTLSVEANDDETGWSTLWSRTGNQGDSWLDAAVVLPASTTRVRFNGRTGSGFTSDMALDDVSFSQFVSFSPSSPQLPSPPPVSPGFDVAVASETKLRSLIEGAAADVSIYLPPSEVEIIDSTVRDCSAGNSGGVVYASSGGTVSIIGSTVTGCSAADYGGVVYASYNELSFDSPGKIAGVDFINNSAGRSGSVLYLDNMDQTSISDASFTGNNGITILAIKSPIIWACRLGRWMPSEGAFKGDFSAPECNPCSAGYYGARSDLTNSSCSG